jgi:hypothetical protein
VKRLLLLGVVFLLPLVPNLAAAPALAAERAVVNAQSENDLFGNGDDRHYTNGLKFSIFYPADVQLRPVSGAAARIPFFEPGTNLRFSLGIGQNIYTPDDITRKFPDPRDRPYAGWLYGSVGMTSEHEDGLLEILELDLGIVGPESFAEDVQTTWHEWIDTTRPEGWAHQLKNEPGIVLFYERKRRAKPHNFTSWLQADFTPHSGLALGNVFTYAAVGATVRIGDGLPTDFGPPRIRPSLPGSGFFDPKGRTYSWYIFAGVEGRAVARNIFLDGNTFTDSASVDRKVLVGDAQLGIVVTIRQVRLAYTQIFRTREFDNQREADNFGALSLSYAF